MEEKIIPVSQPNLLGNEIYYAKDALDSSWISSIGKYIDLFEEKFKTLLGVDHAIAVSNGTVALHLALLALEIGPGDEVIVPNLTYIATANAVVYVGATPVFADCDIDTWNISADSVQKLITKKTKAIIPVHLFGNSCEMERLIELARENNLEIIEDAAEAIGTKFNGKFVGTFGKISTFSFFGNKTITTGEGGMVVTNDKKLAEKLRILKGQGMNPNKRYWFDCVGYNYRMTNIQAAIGLGQMERFDELVGKKQENARHYKKLLGKINGINFQTTTKNSEHSYWMFSIIMEKFVKEKRDDLILNLYKEKIECRPMFYVMTDLPPYKKYWNEGLQVSKYIADRGLSLPSSTLLLPEEIKFISQKVNECFLKDNFMISEAQN